MQTYINPYLTKYWPHVNNALKFCSSFKLKFMDVAGVSR